MSSSRGWETGARDSERLARLMEATRRLACETDQSRVLPYLLESAVGLTGAERGFVLVRREGGMVCVAGAGPATTIAAAAQLSRSILTRVLEHRECILSTDLAADERFRARASVRRAGLRSVLAVPLPSEDGAAGVLYLDSRASRTLFRQEDLELLGAFAAQASLALGSRATIALGRRDAPASVPDRRDAPASVPGRRDAPPLGQRETPARGASPIIGSAPAMRHALELVSRVGPTDLPVLIVGESGTGKELIARAIHASSPRAGGPFVAENCAAIPETLLESELFGAMRGAYTGAERDREGLFRAAEGGSLFLDEIGEMPIGFQARLLRALQEGEVRPVGATRPIKVDARIVAAMNRDPAVAISSGRLRLDLYYRIAGVTIEIPPLRERREDIPALTAHFLSRIAGGMRRVSADALERLLGYDWPGNVRELENEIERAAVLAVGPLIAEGDLSPRLRGQPAPRDPGPQAPRRTGESAMIETALLATGGCVTTAAQAIGWSRQKLYRRMAKLGVPRTYGR